MLSRSTLSSMVLSYLTSARPDCQSTSATAPSILSIFPFTRFAQFSQCIPEILTLKLPSTGPSRRFSLTSRLPPEQQVFSPLKCLTLERSAKRRRTKTTAIMMISTNLFASSFPYPLAYLQAERVYPCPNKIQDYEDSGEVEHRGPAFTHFSPPWPSL